MRTTGILLAFALLIGTLAVPALAATSPATTIAQMKLLTKGNKRYKLYHGALWLEHDKQQHNYRWGGLHCGNNDISELKVSMLFAAFRSKANVNIDYDLHLYKGNRYRCVTGFAISR